MDRYSYDGPVIIFDKCTDPKYHAETLAPSEKKARANMAHAWKLSHGFIPQTKVSLPGKIVKMEETNNG